MLNLRIYANHPKQLVDNMFVLDGVTGNPGDRRCYNPLGKRHRSGTISTRITEADGTVTTLTVPVGDFGF